MSEILLVGEDNPYGANPDFALYPLPERASGGRLQSLVMGLTRGEYLRRFDRANLCAYRWSEPEARARAKELLAGDWRIYVLLGAKVRRAFLGASCTEGVAVLPGGKKLVCIPHPSGLNRTWAMPGAFERVRGILRDAGVLPAEKVSP